MSKHQGIKVAGALSTLAALAACADSPIAPTAGLRPLGPNLSSHTGTPPTDFATLEGEVWVCKTANSGAPADVFDFTYSATGTGSNSPALAGGTTTLSPGECTRLYDLTSVGGQRYEVTVTEGAMPSAEWSFNSVAETFADAGPAPVIVGQSITSVISNDRGVVITFDNLYTPPPPPPTGCTYTQGYWKTHSMAGPAPYDAGWANLGPLEQNTVFYGSGKTWIQLWGTPPRGSAYVQLAHQYMAAKLNVLNGAGTTPEVVAAIAAAESYFSTGTGSIAGLATLLDNYNNGLIGPGHCD